MLAGRVRCATGGLLGLCLAGSGSLAADRYVACAGQEPAWPYTTWAAAASNLQHAVDAAVPGETVWISNSVHRLESTVVVSNAITLRGFAEGAVLDGGGTLRCLDLDTAAAVVADLAIVGGYSAESGGGIRMQNAAVTNCMVSNNVAVLDGGGIWVPANGAGLLVDSRILGNQAGCDGGGVRGRQLRVERCLLEGNRAGRGGGAYLDGRQEIVLCRLLGNIAQTNAGGLMMGASFKLSDCQIQSNVAVTGSAGGVYAVGPPSPGDGIIAGSRILHNIAGDDSAGVWLGAMCVATNCEIAFNACSNLVSYYGGAGIGMGSSAKLYHSQVHHNVATNYYAPGTTSRRYGVGGVYSGYSPLVRNCLVYANRGVRAGGMNIQRPGVVESTTVAGNLAGPGVYTRNMDAGITYFRNCIVAGNLAADLSLGVAERTSLTYCCFPPGALPAEAALLSSNNQEADPLFVNADLLDFRLRGTSPCVDAGSNQLWMADALDLEGSRRVDRRSQRVDIGCYEFKAQGGMLLVR